MSAFLQKLKNIFSGPADNKKLAGLKEKSFNEVEFVVIDLETSGLDTNKDKILSFGGIKIIGGLIEVSESLEKLFRQNEDTDNESVKIHGLLKRNISEGDRKEDGLKEVRSFIGDAIVVGHHVDFDFLKLSNTLEKYYGKPLTNLRLDTAVLAIRLEKGALSNDFAKGEYGLDELCKRYQIEPHDRHTAPGDAFITAQLLLKLNLLAESKGIDTVGKLLERRKSGLF